MYIAIKTLVHIKENDVTVVNSASCITSSSTDSSNLTANSSDAAEVDENGTTKYFVSQWLMYTELIQYNYSNTYLCMYLLFYLMLYPQYTY